MGECSVKVEGGDEMGVMLPQAKECEDVQKPPEARRET